MERFQHWSSYCKSFLHMADTRGKGNRTVMMRIADKQNVYTPIFLMCLYMSTLETYIQMGYLEPKAGVFPSLIISRNVWHWRQHVYLFNSIVIPVKNAMENHFISLRCSTPPFLPNFLPVIYICLYYSHPSPPSPARWINVALQVNIRIPAALKHPRHLLAQANTQASVGTTKMCVACLWFVDMRPVLQRSQTEPSVLVTAICVLWIRGTRIVCVPVHLTCHWQIVCFSLYRLLWTQFATNSVWHVLLQPTVQSVY